VARVCRHYVPILASEHVVELYNGALRRAHGFPKLNPDFVLGFKFDLLLGSSMVEASQKPFVLREKGMLVGFSRKAIALGITLPVQYVQRFNVAFGSPADAQRYHSVIVMVPEKDDVAAVAKGVEDMNLEVADTGAEQAALLIAIFTLIFALVSATIVGIAAVNIMHVFFMLVYERQHEIGIMRAVGASRGDIGRIVLGEAAALGMIAGGAGVMIAVVASWGFDWVSARYVPDFPYKPETYFVFPGWLIVAALGFAVSFCVLGAVLPARRAARMEPAAVLSGH
jgi:ABC-type antimicrobial peptide transport system permease subunit